MNARLILHSFLNGSMSSLYVKQPVLDTVIYNEFAWLTVQGCDEIRPIFEGVAELEIENDYARSKDEIRELQKFSEKLQKQLLNINLNNNPTLKSNLDYTHECLYCNNKYSMPKTKPIKTIEDLPTINQIINNHYKFYILPELEKNIEFFDVNCKFIPLLIRSDGLSLISISSLRTSECIIEPPNHFISGITLESYPFESSERKTPYIPICLADLTKYNIFNLNVDIHSVYDLEEKQEDCCWNWETTLDYNLKREELMFDTWNDNDRRPYINSKAQIFIEGDASF